MDDGLRMTNVYFNRSQKIIKKDVERKVGNITKYHVWEYKDFPELNMHTFSDSGNAMDLSHDK